MWLCWVSGMVFYWAVRLASGAPPGLRCCLPEAWWSFSLSSEAGPVTCPPAWPTAIGAAQFLIKEDKSQADKRERKCSSLRSQQPVCSLAETHTASFPGSLASQSLQTHRQGDRLFTLLCGQGRTVTLQGGQKFSPSQQPSDALSWIPSHPTLLLWFLQQEQVKGGQGRGGKRGARRETDGPATETSPPRASPLARW